jgi:cation:H+ antiporter
MIDNIATYLTGIVSFCVLVFASWCVGEGGEILGEKYDASIIGGLVIAWLNTAPETIFFITALNSNNPRFAVGAVSGSSIVVCTVALGICLWIGASAKKSGHIIIQPAVKKQCHFLLGSLVITAAIAGTGFNILLGSLGIAYYVWFIWHSLNSKETPIENNHEAKQEDLEQQEEEDEEHHEDVSVRKGITYLVVGGLLIFIFSSPFINTVVSVASILEVNPILLAFFLAPIASEAPEILESISLSRKGHSQGINIAFSNLIGGTISKTSLLCGIFCYFGVYKEFIWESPSYTLSLTLLIICAACSAAIGALFKYQTKWHGLALLILFVVTGIIQYQTNVRLGDEVFPDEGFGHDDNHVQVNPAPVA